MSEENNLSYELRQKEKENKDLQQHVEELKEFKYELLSLQTIKQHKDKHIYPSIVWAVCLTFGCYLLLILLRNLFPFVIKKIFDFLSLFEYLGVGCVVYFFVFKFRTRSIGHK